MGEELEALSSVYVWPRDERPKDVAGRHGSLHAKCAVADGQRLPVSSANLTEFALNLNMELGVRVRGGDLPKRLVDYLRQLMQDRVLIPLHSLANTSFSATLAQPFLLTR